MSPVPKMARSVIASKRSEEDVNRRRLPTARKRDQSARSGLRRRIAIALCSGLLLATAWLLWRWEGGVPREDSPLPQASVENVSLVLPPLPPLKRTRSRHLNGADGVALVGNEACQKCHADEHASYEQTGHSRALSRVDVAEEPPDAEYFHPLSKRWYKVYRQDGQLRHRESVRTASGDELVLNDHALDWAIGSGRFSKSYLVELEGFWVESPITWYAANESWSMSPGYDRASHAGFERLADQGCLVCHAGQVTANAGNAFRPAVQHMTIGCESCHGPGSLHAAAREKSASFSGDEDLTIVNPAHLSRELSESVCASCHLRGSATVFRRGLGFDDLRPGLPLSDVRLDYGLVNPSGDMEVVGHVEQMRLSRCYTQSQTMTCITCHDPHHQPAETERVTLYRQACLKCHGDDDCGKPVIERLQVEPRDNCAACHMPTTDTDIPHFAFTHHRIAKPADMDVKPATPRQGDVPTLVPMADVSHLSLAEQNRALGLAYVEFAEKQPAHYQSLLQRAQNLLEQGELDGESAATLARIYWEFEDDRALAQARRALTATELSASSRVNALVVLASARLEAGDPLNAAEALEALTKLRRHSGYWQLLAQAKHRGNDLPGAAAALEKSIEISPQRPDLRRRLAEIYDQLGRTSEAARQRDAAALLRAVGAAQ